MSVIMIVEMAQQDSIIKEKIRIPWRLLLMNYTCH
jgi:hypothetical protein